MPETTTPSFHVRTGKTVTGEPRLEVIAGKHLMLTGEITAGTAPALRALADECDQIVPPKEPDPQAGLFDSEEENGNA